jgi:hypothetical protein
VVRVGQLAPPEAYRPAGGGGNRRVGDDDGNALFGIRIENVGSLRLMSAPEGVDDGCRC